ncbi:MAG: HAD-IC family P-type ATPase, partial [Muribaculaceae bacterium]|nr:HAD-IC family P-type ATPase [Muribaculaceae bacterium]
YEYFGLNQGPAVFFEPAGIFMAVILATGLSFYFEQKAEKEFNLLNTVNDDEPVQVVRNGNATQVPRRDIVVGDIVVLNTGDEVPADGNLLEAVNLSVDESSLTGEPLASKTTDPERFDNEATYRSDHVLRGTKVMEGHGVMKVTEVGDRTENGKVFESARIDNSVKTPLNEQLERLGVLISRFAYIVALLIIVGRVVMFFFNSPFEWISFIQYLLNTIMIAVAIICVAVPEGLPMAITLSLAYSMRRMLKTNNLVRKMHASETMGATTVICTDKTGTLTENQMRVAKFDIFGHPEPGIIEEGIAVNSTARLDLADPTKPSVLGNPTEGALLLWLRSRDIDFEPLRDGVERVEELPFSTERKYMATVVRRRDGRTILYVKGAPEIVFGLCKDTAGLTRAELDAALLVYQNQAMRTLGFAYADLTPGETVIDNNRVVADNLIFLA